MKALGFDDPADAGLEPKGQPLSVEQERQVISQRWRQRD